MIADNWLLVFGIPAIIALIALTIRRIRRLGAHIDEVRDELARSPLPPFAQLSEIMQETAEERKRGQGTH